MSSGYISEILRTRIRQQAKHQCGYCRSQQKYVLGQLEIEHIIPKAMGGTDDEENLWLACRLCNNYKGIQTHAQDPESKENIRLFDPRKQRWSEHFRWSIDGTRIIGITACGQVTVIALQLNNPYAVTVREAWTSVGWHPPDD